jgi:pyruvate/2-oxoglutarate dehydrogenase complex dihydrolipoamide dehydrogenase (E3) component
MLKRIVGRSHGELPVDNAGTRRWPGAWASGDLVGVPDITSVGLRATVRLASGFIGRWSVSPAPLSTTPEVTLIDIA